MIKLTDVSKRFGSTQALSNVNFSIGKDQVVGFLGPNGAGKTTTMRLITSFFFPTSGTVRVAGLDVRQHHLQVRRLIGYLPEDNPLYPDMYVSDYLEFIAHIRQINSVNTALNQVKQWCGLNPVWSKKIGAISKGYRQRVGLAQALIHQPQVLILDEPTAGLDPNQMVDIRRLIIDLGRDKTVLLSTHILPEVSQTCRRAIVINHGQIVTQSKVSDLTKTNQAKQVVHLVVKGGVKVVRAVEKLAIVEELKQNPLANGQTKLSVTLKSLKKKHLLPETIIKAGGSLIEMTHQKRSLEEVFSELTQETQSKKK